MMQNTFFKLFQQFGVEPDRHGCALIEHDGMQVVMQDCGDDSLVIYAAVGVLPQEPDEKLLVLLLNANLPGKAGLPGRTGLDEPTRILVYSMVIPGETAVFDRVVERLDLFTATARSLMAQIEELGGDSRGDSAKTSEKLFEGDFALNMLRV